MGVIALEIASDRDINHDEEELLYLEVSKQNKWLKLLMYPLTAVYFVVFCGALVFGRYSFAAPFGLGVVVFVLIIVAFGRLTFSISKNYEMVFGYSVFRKRFPISSIVSCEPYTITFANYYGYGVRGGRDGTTAYITRNGPGIKLDIKGKKRPYVVSVDDPEKICKIIKEFKAVK